MVAIASNLNPTLIALPNQRLGVILASLDKPGSLPTFLIAARARRGQASSVVWECEADSSVICDTFSKEDESQRCRPKRTRILGRESHAVLNSKALSDLSATTRKR